MISKWIPLSWTSSVPFLVGWRPGRSVWNWFPEYVNKHVVARELVRGQEAQGELLWELERGGSYQGNYTGGCRGTE
jgi:hypothetical protein